MSRTYGWSTCEYAPCSKRYLKKAKHQRFHTDICRQRDWIAKHSIGGRLKDVYKKLEDHEARILKLEQAIKTKEE